MHTLFKHQQARITHFQFRLDKSLYIFCTYALPVFIAILSVFALIVLDAKYTSGTPDDIEFKFIKQGAQSLTPASAAIALRDVTPTHFLDTNRSEAFFWLSFALPEGRTGEKMEIEFPSRHAVDIECWDDQMRSVGMASRERMAGDLSPVKSGFALAVPQVSNGGTRLCRTRFVGPAHASISRWSATALNASSDNFHRKAGLLDGGLLILAVFMLVTALIVRQSRYLLFAAWLLVTLRVGLLSAGWDTQWLGQTIPYEWLLRIRLLTVSTYCVLTLTLFMTMFRDELAIVGKVLPLRLLQLTCFPLIILSATLSYRQFLPFLWVASGITVVAVIVYLVRILIRIRSTVAMLYAASLTITVLASLSEILAAAFGWRELTSAINSVTAALSSSLLASLAMAEQMRMEHQDRVDAQAELAHTYAVNPIGLFTLDSTGKFLSANPAMMELLGGNVLAEGKDRWPQYLNASGFGALFEAVLHHNHAEVEVENDEIVAPSIAKRFLVKATLDRGKVEASLQDISEKHQAMESLRFLANNDSLTRVFNRRGIEKLLETSLSQLDNRKPLAIAYLDLDRFKLLNSLYGHTAGDEVLQQICSRIQNMLTDSQQIGRIGGDEFLIIFSESPIELAAWTCRGILASLGSVPYKIGDSAFQVRASLGLIEIGAGMTLPDVIAAADRACREAKAKGANGLVVYEKTASVFQEHEAEFRIVKRLSCDTGPDGLFLDMQPIMSLRSPHASLNFEVLVRMRDSDGTVIQAGQILGAAEKSGRTNVIDRWVLGTTLDWIETNLEKLHNTEFICMNLSGASLNDERFIEDAIVLLDAHATAALRLCIEITESVALHDRGNTRRFIDTVRGHGVKIALDDFGAGYTSFAYLAELPADVLKIDGSFIVNLNQNPANVAIVEAIVRLAKNLGMQTIAEWAEDAETVETLVDIGIDHVQGYVIARPQTPEKIFEVSSAAGFIKDEQLAAYVRTLGETSLSLA